MNRKIAILLALMSLFICTLGLFRLSAAPAAHKTLSVKVNYTGAGVVDQQHKIYVLLFDSNPFTASKLVDLTSKPTLPAPEAGVSHIIRRQSASSKNESVTFNDLSVSPVYAAAFFDKNGIYNPQTFMIEGAPMGVYGKAPDQPEPIKLSVGKTVEVTLGFDDSIKAP
jgi:hypothetical protein